MSIEFSLQSARPTEVEADLLVIPVLAGAELGPGGDALDAALGGGLAAFMDQAHFEGKRAATLAVPAGDGVASGAVLLLGVGESSELDADAFRRLGATIAKRSRKHASVASTVVDVPTDAVERVDAAQAFAEGVVLGSYQYLEYKSEGEAGQLARVTVLGRRGARVARALDRGARVAQAAAWTRDLVNVPSLDKAPETVVASTRALLRGTGVRVTVWEGQKLVDERLGGVIGVGQGSSRPPRLMKLTYSPAAARTSLALVGKGVVFDSGGISIKPASGMETMKTDMSGAGAVIGAMSALADLEVKTKVTGYVPLVENMPSGDAIRPGDVLTHRNGKTVEVINTDAEGRLILADALALAAEDGHDAVIDLATLTGACVVALGEKVAGLMGNNDAWTDQILAAGERAGEPIWKLPLPKDYRKQLDSEVADLKNIGDRYAGALTAGLFLSEFAGDGPWAHLDIAGPARAGSDDGYLTKGGTGFGVRTLLELVTKFRKPR